ncbi:DUF3667 domain-containing protein [Kordiimonas sp. SCSIO 12603]|uniref:DUF3667 domain-containing protein n=1 Tax=Kordiimonas sp. SCSIO 12603 TaxID=2829596 RepID=UPI0021077789|nr:DUF3667 domain-containing protein [Kordiimonas sp. SCSIO 12603]UTW57450.1 DUF3667 domain-containing protein [Kordiimonas sp. SCSIO 12603]
MAEAKTTCANCYEPMHGSYCYACGQKDIGTRLTIKVFISQMLEALTEVDSKFWRTLRELTLNPGRVALNYINGNRASYINPVKYLFVCFAIYFSLTVITGFHEIYVQEAVNEGEGSQVTQEEVNSIEVKEDNVQVQVSAEAIRDMLRNQLNLLVFMSIPLTAFFLRWQYFRAKHNYPEVLSFLCFIVGHSYFLSIFLVILMWLFDAYQKDIRTLLMLALFFFGARVFFKMGWIISFLGTIATLLLTVISVLVVGASLVLINLYIA